MDLETVIQSEVSQKEKNKYPMLMHICGIQKNGTDEPVRSTLLFAYIFQRIKGPFSPSYVVWREGRVDSCFGMWSSNHPLKRCGRRA